MCGCYCIDFTEYITGEKTLLNYTNSFSPSDYNKNNKVVYKYLKDKYGKIKRKTWLPFTKTNRVTGKTRNHLLKELNHNDLLGEKLQKVFRARSIFLFSYLLSVDVFSYLHLLY